MFRACVTALLALQIGAGCAWFKPPDPVPPGFERIALRTQVEMGDDGKLRGDTHSDSAVKGATLGLGVGSVSGAGVGFGGGLVFCSATAVTGPLVIIAYPVCVIVSTFVGTVVGGVSGTVVGGSTGLPWKTTNEVNALLVDLQKQRDFPGEFQTVLEGAIPRAKLVDEDRAEATVTARLEEVDLRQHLTQRLSFRMRASMAQQWPNGHEPLTKTCEYEYTSPPMDVEDWLLHDGELFRDTFSEGMETFARWMAHDLDAFAERRAKPAVAGVPATCFQVED